MQDHYTDVPDSSNDSSVSHVVDMGTSNITATLNVHSTEDESFLRCQ